MIVSTEAPTRPVATHSTIASKISYTKKKDAASIQVEWIVGTTTVASASIDVSGQGQDTTQEYQVTASVDDSALSGAASLTALAVGNPSDWATKNDYGVVDSNHSLTSNIGGALAEVVIRPTKDGTITVSITQGSSTRSVDISVQAGYTYAVLVYGDTVQVSTSDSEAYVEVWKANTTPGTATGKVRLTEKDSNGNTLDTGEASVDWIPIDARFDNVETAPLVYVA